MNDQAQAILGRTREILANAERGFGDLSDRDPALKRLGLANVAVYGRSATLVLQNLRSVDRERFNEWYAPYAEVMGKDPLMKYFSTLRNTVLKKGTPDTRHRTTVHSFSTDDPAVYAAMQYPPPGAYGFFVGDEMGGTGWYTQGPTGAQEKIYIDLPSVPISQSLHLPDPPTEHLGQRLDTDSAETLCGLYLHYLSDLVSDAEAEFSK